MAFSEPELRLLEVACQHFSTPPMLERLKMFKKGKFDHSGWGVEYWFQTELIYALENTKELDVRVKGKTKRDCDLIVDNIGVELKASKRATWSNLRRAFTEHKNADLYLFLTWRTDRLWKNLNRYMRKNVYEMKFKELGELGWRILIVKRVKKTQ